MSFMKGDLLSRTSKLVKGFAKAEPGSWQHSLSLPRMFISSSSKHRESKHEDAIKMASNLVIVPVDGISRRGKAKKESVFSTEADCTTSRKKQPPNPYPSAIKERKFMRDGFYNPDILKIQAELQDRRGGGGWHALVLIALPVEAYKAWAAMELDQEKQVEEAENYMKEAEDHLNTAMEDAMDEFRRFEGK
ncbi:hypothetical protein HAX54_043974 [Datura stramonium]|uniref:Uncharacterized protein n=1 Tax=Datura stramonium TaxID=4076 RepID=A0ABS8W5C8_DATST|nr:hypothetical protein [Datura stramonium]